MFVPDKIMFDVYYSEELPIFKDNDIYNNVLFMDKEQDWVFDALNCTIGIMWLLFSMDQVERGWKTNISLSGRQLEIQVNNLEEFCRQEIYEGDQHSTHYQKSFK